MLNLQELFFFRMKMDRDTDDLAVLELATNALILNIFLEATYIIRLYIFLRVRSIPRYGNRVKHSHQVGKGLCIAVVRCGRSKDKGVTLLGKELSEVATQAVLVGHLMTLIYHDDVPMGLLKPCTEATIVLQRIDTDDGLVVIVKGILVERYLTLNLGNTDTVKTNKRYGKAVPDFFLELGKNALQGTYKDTFSLTPAYHFAEEDANFNSLSKANAVSNKKTRTWKFKSLQCRFHLVLCNIISTTLRNGNLL